MENPILRMYIDSLLSIKQGMGVQSKSLAKPISIISLIDCISMLYLTENKFSVDNMQIKQQYEYYQKLYPESNIPNISIPFYHMSSAPFYHLIWKSDEQQQIKGTPSAKFLRDHLLYAKLDDKLWELLQDAESRELIKRSIIQKYLPHPL